MLLHRILTAVPLAAAVIWLILFQPTSVLLYALLLVVLICGYEWARLSCVKSRLGQLAFALIVTLFTWAFIEYLADYFYLLLVLTTVWWLVMPFYLKTAKPELKDYMCSPAKLLVAFLVVPATVIAMYVIHAVDRGPELLLFGLMLVWVADIGAYFSGKKLGRTKLAPDVSPGKTLEGLWGALFATGIYAVLGAYYFELSLIQLLLLLAMSLLLTVLSVAGDLYESYLKREAGIKDSGHILPGHGGILDRVDGVFAVMPVFVVMFDLLIVPIEGLY